MREGQGGMGAVAAATVVQVTGVMAMVVPVAVPPMLVRRQGPGQGGVGGIIRVIGVDQGRGRGKGKMPVEVA